MMAAEVSKPTRLGIFNTKLSDLPMINVDHLLWMNYVIIAYNSLGIKVGNRIFLLGHAARSFKWMSCNKINDIYD